MRVLFVLGLINILLIGTSASFADRDEYWEMRVHEGENIQIFVVTDIDSISFHSVQIPSACCVNGICTTVTEAECIQVGGYFYPDSDCSPSPCPPFEAVCCGDDGYCVIMIEEYCELVEGIWHPEWDNCDPNPCLLAGEMVIVPAGTFIMGDGEAHCGLEEHEVTLTRGFYLGKQEVSNQEYMEAVQWAFDNEYVNANTSSVWDNLDGRNEELLNLDSIFIEIQFDGAGVFYLRESPSGYAQSAYPGGYDPSTHPVKEVTWYGAVRYCDWLSLQTELQRAYEHTGDWSCNGGDPYGAVGYRLPTDAEWEYAAQFDDERIYPWGDEVPECSRTNYRPADYCIGWTSPVGSYSEAPLSLGLFDMAGNLIEWCNDWRVCELGFNPVTDPVGPSFGTRRILRGGSWNFGSENLPCAYRSTNVTSDEGIGFRIARTAE
jgi:formylglycine-generating enzyme required for sulfatase activity